MTPDPSIYWKDHIVELALKTSETNFGWGEDKVIWHHAFFFFNKRKMTKLSVLDSNVCMLKEDPVSLKVLLTAVSSLQGDSFTIDKNNWEIYLVSPCARFMNICSKLFTASATVIMW